MKGYRTLIINGAMLVLAFTDYFVANSAVLGSVITDPKKTAFAVIGVNILNIFLRFITTGPVGK